MTLVTPTGEQIDALLPYIDKFEADDFSVEKWGDNPWFDYDESVDQFSNALYENGWDKDFDWAKWQDSAQKYVESPEYVTSADVATI